MPLNFFIERYTEAYAAEIKAFCNALVAGTEPPAGGFDGFVAVAIAIAAKKSFLENRPVKMSEVLV